MSLRHQGKGLVKLRVPSDAFRNRLHLHVLFPLHFPLPNRVEVPLATDDSIASLVQVVFVDGVAQLVLLPEVFRPSTQYLVAVLSAGPARCVVACDQERAVW